MADYDYNNTYNHNITNDHDSPPPASAASSYNHQGYDMNTHDNYGYSSEYNQHNNNNMSSSSTTTNDLADPGYIPPHHQHGGGGGESPLERKQRRRRRRRVRMAVAGTTGLVLGIVLFSGPFAPIAIAGGGAVAARVISKRGEKKKDERVSKGL